jgi:hypothetical protein
VTQELVQLPIIANGELEGMWVDTGLLVATNGGGAPENSGEVGKVNGGTSTDILSVFTLAGKAADTTNREDQTSLGRRDGVFLPPQALLPNHPHK